MKKLLIVLTLGITMFLSGCMTNYQRGYVKGFEENGIIGYIEVEVPVIEYIEVPIDLMMDTIIEIPVYLPLLKGEVIETDGILVHIMYDNESEWFQGYKAFDYSEIQVGDVIVIQFIKSRSEEYLSEMYQWILVDTLVVEDTK